MIEIAAGSPADIDLVEAIMADAFDPRFGEAWTRNQCLGVLALPGVWLMLARRDGVPAAFALSRQIVDEAELLLLATVPAQRGGGVGGALLRAVLADARTRGAAAMHLEVRDGNDAARLYRAAGFAKVGERRNYYRGKLGRAFDAHTYRREL